MIRARAIATALLTIAGTAVAEGDLQASEVAVWRASLQLETSDGPHKVHFQTITLRSRNLATLLRSSNDCPTTAWPDDTAARIKAANEVIVRLDDSLWTVQNAKRTRRARRSGDYMFLTRPVFDPSGTRALLIVVTSTFSGDLLEATRKDGTWTVRRCNSWLDMY